MKHEEIAVGRAIGEDEIAMIAGAGAMEDGYTFGKVFGDMYWGSRNYLADTVYPYWLG